MVSIGPMDILAAIEDAFGVHRDAGALERAFGRWALDGGPLGGFGCLDGALAACRDPMRPASVKNTILGRLCMLACEDDEDAKIVLTWLMLPGLLRLRSTFPRALAGLGAEEIDAVLLAGFWQGVAAATHGQTGVAARLLNASRHATAVFLRQHIDWTVRADLAAELPEPSRDAPEDPVFELTANILEPTACDVLRRALREGVVSALQADLLLADSDTRRSVAEKWGLTAEQARCRRNRAVARLTRWVAEQSQPVFRE